MMRLGPTITLVVQNNKAADAVFKFASENPSVAVVWIGGRPTCHILRKYEAWTEKHHAKWSRLKNPDDDPFEDLEDLENE
jgi:hypothetical protein